MKNFQSIVQNLKQIHHLFIKILAKDLSGFELHNHFDALVILALHKQPITQNKLAELLQIDKSRVTNIVFELEKKDLIYTKRNMADRREHFVYLSQPAMMLMPDIEKTVNGINQLAVHGVPDEKLHVFIEVLEIMMQNLTGRIKAFES